MSKSWWNGNGIAGDAEQIADAISTLGLDTNELMALVDYLRREAALWEEVGREEIATFMRRRAQTFTALASLVSDVIEKIQEEEQ